MKMKPELSAMVAAYDRLMQRGAITRDEYLRIVDGQPSSPHIAELLQAELRAFNAPASSQEEAAAAYASEQMGRVRREPDLEPLPETPEGAQARREYEEASTAMTEDEKRLHDEYMGRYYPNPAPAGFWERSNSSTPEGGSK